ASADVTRFIGGKPRSRQDAWFALLRGAGLWALKGFGYWVVTDRQTGAFLGEAGFADFQRGLNDELVSGPEAGWAFAPETWGRGIASEAVHAIHQWLDTSRPQPSCCIIEPDNAASVRVAQRAGYRLIGTTFLAGAEVGAYSRGA
ncbi:MAG: GNAT family N-acetyltransferase, partial [Hyphomonas sp.]